MGRSKKRRVMSCHSPIMATHEGNVASAKICLEVGNKLLAGQEDLSRSKKGSINK